MNSVCQPANYVVRYMYMKLSVSSLQQNICHFQREHRGVRTYLYLKKKKPKAETIITFISFLISFVQV